MMRGPRLVDLPLTAIRLADPLSVIYFAKTAGLPKSEQKDLVESALARRVSIGKYSRPVFPNVFSPALRRRLPADRFKPEPCADLSFGYAALGLRALHAKPASSRTRKQAAQAVSALETCAFRDPNGLYWLKFAAGFRHLSTRPTINFGFSTGIAGPLLFLSACARAKIERRRCVALIESVESFLRPLAKKPLPAFIDCGTNRSSDFEGDLVNDNGDLCVGYAFLLAGLRLKRPEWIRFGKRLFRRGARAIERFADRNTPYVSKGWAGYALLFFRYAELTGDSSALKKSRLYLRRANETYWSTWRKRELAFTEERMRRLRFYKGQERVPDAANLLNSSLGLYLVNETVEGRLRAKWDSILGFTNPVTGKIV
jgi:hypothetical protein